MMDFAFNNNGNSMGGTRYFFRLLRGWLVSVYWLALNAAVWGEALPIQISGAKGISESDLKAALVKQFDDTTPANFNAAMADDVEWVVAAHYRKQGFLEAKADVQLRDGSIAITVTEGPQSIVRSLTFSGNHGIDSKTLYEYMLGVDPEKLLEVKLPYYPDWLTEGMDRIRGVYGSQGWLDAEVTERVDFSGNGSLADIALTIQEGVHYTFGTICFTGDPRYAREELIAALDLSSGKDFTPLAADTAAKLLVEFYKNKGHFAAEVAVAFDVDTATVGRVAVAFDCHPGPVYRVGRIFVKNSGRLSPEFLPKRFRHLKGEIYNQELIDERNRDMMRSGLFKKFRVHAIPEGGDTLRLEIEAEEAQSREFSMELGYGSYDGGIVGMTWRDRNFMGNGRPLSLGLRSSQRGLQSEVLYRDPWWLDGPWGLRARLYSDLREEDGYDRSGVGSRFDLSRKYGQSWETALYFVGEYTSITNPLIDVSLIGPQDYVLAAFGLSQTLDRRDDPWSPKRGWIASSTMDVDTLDGELAFGRATLRYSQYWSWKKTLLAVGARVGMIIPTGDSESVPIDLRYFNGGANTVRSYGERDLGPKDKGGYPLGGNFYTVLNVEWEFPIYGALKGAVFSDAGNLSSDYTPSLDEMGYAVGLGLRYQLPIGPIRMDYGYNPDPKENDHSGAFHISFGMAF